MLFGAAGLRTHIWNNNLRSVFLLTAFPVLLGVLGYGLALLWVALAGRPDFVMHEGEVIAYFGTGLGGDFRYAWSRMPQIMVGALIVAWVWFLIAWFTHQGIIDRSTGAHEVTREDEPELYNLLENLCISRGIPMPRLAVIENRALNAFASGLNQSQYRVTVTRGLMRKLDREELEAVLAHELSHIRNGDVRLMVVAVIFVGIFSFVGEFFSRGLFRRGRIGPRRVSVSIGGMRGGGSGGRGGSGGGGGGGAAVLLLAALALIAIAWALAVLVRFSLSRRREYMADAGAVELTKNPDALISALQKISGRSQLGETPDEIREMFIENPRVGFMGLFATHPPIEKRIDMLVEHAGGRRPQTGVPTV
ncbi:MAG: M48 family metallopeptidase [Pseudomonadota bacterium]|nr:M48 family metallopeptidase [Pseudomonadota bacterium]